MQYYISSNLFGYPIDCKNQYCVYLVDSARPNLSILSSWRLRASCCEVGSSASPRNSETEAFRDWALEECSNFHLLYDLFSKSWLTLGVFNRTKLYGDEKVKETDGSRDKKKFSETNHPRNFVNGSIFQGRIVLASFFLKFLLRLEILFS
jgi:hypothetical protein